MISKTVAATRARNLLSKCGINFENINVKKEKDCSIDVKAIAAKLDIKVIEHPFSENISGVFFRTDDELFLGVNKAHSPHRQRFTIAHEIGHYLLHAGEKIHYDVVKEPQKSDQTFYRADSISGECEREANQFAAELLMPKVLVVKCIENGMLVISDLAERFNVSVDAMRYRLINLGYL